jgi:hypothetical protein
VQCQLDTNTYPKGITISDAEMAALNITRHDFHGEWNYTLCSYCLTLPKLPPTQ